MKSQAPARTKDGLVIRKLAMTDADATAKYFSDPRVLRPVRGSVGHYSIKDARDYIRRKNIQYGKEKEYVKNGQPEKIGYALEWKGIFVGGIGFTPFDHKAEIGYWIARPYWGQGIATNAVKLFIVHLKRKYHFTRFEAKVFSFNLASCRVLEKVGFQKEGIARHDFRVGKKYFDHVLYGKIVRPASR